MEYKPVSTDDLLLPAELRPLLRNAEVFDRSGMSEAKTLFINKDGGYFLKSAPKGGLELEAALMRYFHAKGLTANVLSYISDEQDWLLTGRIPGDDCTSEKYLAQPKRLCDILAERLAMLHATDYAGCPVQNHTQSYLAVAGRSKLTAVMDKNPFSDKWNIKTVDEARNIVKEYGCLLHTDTLLHGDYCLPNIILKNWEFSGFIDLGSAGVGDRHVDVYWAMWSLNYNLETDKFSGRFLDAYGRDEVDGERLRVVAAAEVFG
jgi:kanamycin kinase